MQMILAAVLLVMGILNIFLLFIIRQIVIITNRQVQRHFTVELETCGKELEETLTKLSGAKKELEELTARRSKQTEKEYKESQMASDSRLAPVPGFRNPRYRGEESLETYRYIRDHMKLDYQKLAQQALLYCPKQDQIWDACSRIQEKLNFEQLYELMLMPDDEQQNRLGELLSQEELAALEQVAPYEQNSDISARVDEVRQYLRLHDPKLRVESAEPIEFGEEEENIQVEYNPQIHEGIRLHIGPGVLDYSL